MSPPHPQGEDSMKKLVGLFASVALMTSGVAQAQDQHTDTSMQSGQGGSGSQTGSQSGSQMGSQGSQMGSQMGGSGSQAAMGGNEVKGQVIKSDKKTVFLK